MWFELGWQGTKDGMNYWGGPNCVMNHPSFNKGCKYGVTAMIQLDNDNGGSLEMT